MKELPVELADVVLNQEPTTKWDDIVGLDAAKQFMKEATLPLKFPHLFVGRRMSSAGILLCGPPGTGKCYLINAAATETNSTLLVLNSGNLVLKETPERLVKQLFEFAKETKPAIILVEALESFKLPDPNADSGDSRKLVTDLLVQMSAVHGDTGILVIGTTTAPWKLEKSIKRRFQRHVYFSLPGVDARRQILEIRTGTTSPAVRLVSEDFQTLAEKTEGYSSLDLTIIVQKTIQNSEAYLPASDPGAAERSFTNVEPGESTRPLLGIQGFLEALETTPPTVSPEEIKEHEDWAKDYGTVYALC